MDVLQQCIQQLLPLLHNIMNDQLWSFGFLPIKELNNSSISINKHYISLNIESKTSLFSKVSNNLNIVQLDLLRLHLKIFLIVQLKFYIHFFLSYQLS